MKKTVIAILTLVVMVFSLCACNGSDPNEGVYVATKGEAGGTVIDSDKMDFSSFKIELNSGGKCNVIIEDDQSEGTWSTNGNSIHIDIDGESIDGTIKENIIEVKDFAGIGLGLTFTKKS